MNLKQTALSFVTIFIVVLLVSVLVTYLYSLIIYNIGVINWETSFQLAIIFGIILTWLNYQDGKEKKNEQKDKNYISFSCNCTGIALCRGVY